MTDAARYRILVISGEYSGFVLDSGEKEDYGNLEQLNYFVNYLHQAGATVVPFRPVGYQDNWTKNLNHSRG